jgi:hypothetical protein
VMVLYNYFREKWLVDRLANTAADVFGRESIGHVHQDRAYLAVMLAGPRVAELKTPSALPADVNAYGQPHAPSPARPLVRDASVVMATDDWPFLYLRYPSLPGHYTLALALVLAISGVAVWLALNRVGTRFSGRFARFAERFDGLSPSQRRRINGVGTRFGWQFFWLGAGFMLLETKSIVQFALLWGSTWSSASLAIASVLVMALASAIVTGRVAVRRRAPIVVALLALVAVNYMVPVGRVTFGSRAMESIFYGLLVFSPVFCAGLLFSSSFKESSSPEADFGANLLGAMAGGAAEYLSLLAGYRFLLILVAACYLCAIAASRSLHGERRIISTSR